ncbi:MAG: M1 family metallopeptidase [Acidobacteriota bacterium]|nr:M1 family metallopeptidase [Acidobacteriota bacterium]
MKKQIVFLTTLFVSTATFAARLPATVIPNHYAITIATDLANETFHGEETIDVDVKEPVSSITMHAIGFTFHDVSVTTAGATTPANVGENAANEMITLTLPQPISAGPATIHIAFNGAINKQLRGLYLSRTPARTYAVTQFEATDARRAFPSFDEPAMKATFDIGLIVDKNDTAISNSPIRSDSPEGDTKHRIQFATTPKISTYLVAMLIGDFQCIEGGVDGTPIRVCTTPGRQQNGQFALEMAQQAVHFYNNYYDIRYPFQKLDLIGLPDFEAGAMENAGAITFRETALLIDPKTASVGQRKNVAGTVTHEVAHMWFGDLVTMKWWDDVWLNEGFATFMTSKPIEAWKPEWNEKLDTVGGTLSSLNLDSQRATRSIRTPAETSDEINQLFDGIAYGKTAAVLRMVEQWMGEDAFRDGIRAYLKKYAWTNAAAEDFWGTMAATSKKPVDVVMKSFVDQPGAPLVRASDTCKGKKRIATLEQQRLLPAGQDVAQTWALPICPKGGTRCYTLTTPQLGYELDGCSQPLFLNRDGRGYYVTDYSARERDLLKTHLKDLNTAERMVLRSNESLLVTLMRRDISDYLALLQAMPRPAERPLADAIAGNLEGLDRQLVNDNNRTQWQHAVRSLLTGYAPATWDAPAGETEESRLIRASVLSDLGVLGADPKIISGARDVTDRYLSDPTAVNPTIAGRALGIAATFGDAALFDRLMSLYEKTDNPSLKNSYLFSLTQFRDPKLFPRAIDYAFSGKVRSQNLPGFLAALESNPYARDQAWTAVKAHWADLQRDIPTAIGALTGSLAGYCSADSKKDIETFFANHQAGSGSRSLRRALEAIDRCVAFRAAQQASFDRAIAKMQ